MERKPYKLIDVSTAETPTVWFCFNKIVIFSTYSDDPAGRSLPVSRQQQTIFQPIQELITGYFECVTLFPHIYLSLVLL